MSKALDLTFVAAIVYRNEDMATKLLSISGLSDPNTWYNLYQWLCKILPTSNNILQLLLSQVDDEALTKIFRAAIDGDNYLVVDMIMNERPIVEMKASEENGNTALHIAVQRKSIEVVSRLCYTVADIDAKNKEGSSALHLLVAIKDDAFDLMSATSNFLNADADCNMRDQFGRTALHIAAIHKNEEVIKQLLAFGADVNVTCDNNLTPLECGPQSDNLKRHIVAMIALNIYVSNKNLSHVDLAGEDRASFEYYRLEIEYLKSQGINSYAYDMYDFLTCGLNRLAAYAENWNFISNMNWSRADHDWYEGFVYKRIELGEKRKGLFRRSLKSLEIAVGALFGRALPDVDIAWEITDYLSNEDLENLVKAAPSEDYDS